MENNEIWKDIPGYEGHYQASNLGNIKSLKQKSERIIKPAPDMEGRLKLSLYQNGTKEHFKVYTLVALTFIGERPEGYDVCHIDGDFSNNNLSNIKYDTKSQNRVDMYRYGSKNVRGKLDIEEVLEIRRLYKTGKYYQYQIAEMFNIQQSTVGRIILKKTFPWLNDDGTIQESKTEIC